MPVLTTSECFLYRHVMVPHPRSQNISLGMIFAPVLVIDFSLYQHKSTFLPTGKQDDVMTAYRILLVLLIP